MVQQCLGTFFIVRMLAEWSSVFIMVQSLSSFQMSVFIPMVFPKYDTASQMYTVS